MNEPLAQRLRPKSLAEVCGQQHLLGEGKVFRRAVENGRIPNMIFYGPSGVGKNRNPRYGVFAAGSKRVYPECDQIQAGTIDREAVCVGNCPAERADSAAAI